MRRARHMVWGEEHFPSVVFLGKTTTPPTDHEENVAQFPAEGQPTKHLTVLLTTAKVIKNKESLVTVTARRSRRGRRQLPVLSRWGPGLERGHSGEVKEI